MTARLSIEQFREVWDVLSARGKEALVLLAAALVVQFPSTRYRDTATAVHG